MKVSNHCSIAVNTGVRDKFCSQGGLEHEHYHIHIHIHIHIHKNAIKLIAAIS